MIKKELLIAFKASGKHTLVLNILSLCHLLMSLVAELYFICEEISKLYGLSVGEHKMNMNKASKAFDNYSKSMVSLIEDKEKVVMPFFKDYESLKSTIIKWSKLKI